jgi:hypothetical protein
MTTPRLGIRRRPASSLLPGMLAGVGAVTLLVGVLVAALIWSSGGPGDSQPKRLITPDPVRVTGLAVPAQRARSVVQPEQPETAQLPSGAVVPIRAVSTRPDGSLDVPENIRTAGWWRGGSRLGDPFGSTLLAAHIDSTTQGLGPYAELLAVRPEQRIVLDSATLEQVFQIRSLRLVSQGSLADEPWIFAASGPRRLTLVTCAPPYDASRGGYQNLAIVIATPVANPTPRTR